MTTVATRSRRGTEPDDLVPPDERLRVLSQLIARELEREPDVQAYRATRLGGQLVPETELDDWILAQHERDGGRATPYVEVPRAADGTLMVDAAGQSQFFHTLQYTQPPDWLHEGTIQLPHGGVLAELYALSRRFGEPYGKFGWAPAAVATFILTGVISPIPAARVTARYAASGRIGASDRIILDVHPTLAPMELVAFYRRARERLKPPRLHRAKRPHSAIVNFVTEQRRAQPEISWHELWQAWNAAYPDDWSYTAAKNLKRDYLRAVKLAGQDTVG